MNPSENLREEIFQICFSMDEKVILEMNENKSNIELNNVVIGLSSECFGLRLSNNPYSVLYQLFYVNGKKRLTGYLLNMNLDNPNRDELVFIFANNLAHQYPHLDSIDVFNSFQQHLRSMLEKEGYFTVSSWETEKFEGMDYSLIAPGVKGIIKIPIVDKVEFLREYFGNRHLIQLLEQENYVYLMINVRNGLIKIGTSIRPQYREKTLQGEDPSIFLVSLWPAPKSIERELHKMFLDKKKRGEWFKLKSREMQLIKDRMAEFL